MKTKNTENTKLWFIYQYQKSIIGSILIFYLNNFYMYIKKYLPPKLLFNYYSISARRHLLRRRWSVPGRRHILIAKFVNAEWNRAESRSEGQTAALALHPSRKIFPPRGLQLGRLVHSVHRRAGRTTHGPSSSYGPPLPSVDGRCWWGWCCGLCVQSG